MIEHLFENKNRETFAFSGENPTGKKGAGSKGGDCTKLRPSICIKPGETATLVDVDGPAIIQHMWFAGYVGRGFILRIYWENNKNPSVEAPLPAFFGVAYDEQFKDIDGKFPYLNSSLIMVAPGRGLNSYFEMPFLKHCKITIENRGNTEEWLYYMITGCKTSDLPSKKELCYFHASYRQAHPNTKGKSYVVIDGIKGKGHFVGMTLASGINGNNTCWVEGEARMYLDGDKYPSIFYTGTEDYFCGSYAFGNDCYNKKYQTYSGLYAGMFSMLGNTSEMYNNQQRFLLYRFHVVDPIYFNKDFKMTLDNLGWTGPRYDDYTSVAYWYQTLPFEKLKELPSHDECNMK